MPDYHLYTARDFALDEDFQQWVLQPDVMSNQRWEAWLRRYPEKRATVEEAVMLVRSIRFREYPLSDGQKEQLWDAIWDNIADHETHDMGTIPAAGKRLRRIHTWKYAAALLAGLLVAAFWFMERQQRFRPVTLSVSTQLGAVKRFRLPDSSEVTLNAGSRLVYTEKTARQREVWLEGEAYFHVRHTADNQKFIVHTYDRLSVEVLGTRFNVNSFGDKIAVVLQQGSIKLHIKEEQHGQETQLYLRPGEMLRYSKQDGAYAKSGTDADRAISWTQRRLNMEDYTLSDAIQFMQQVFGKHIAVRDSQLLRYKVSGSMPITYNADTMLMQFGKTFGVHFHEENGEIQARKK